MKSFIFIVVFFLSSLTRGESSLMVRITNDLVPTGARATFRELKTTIDGKIENKIVHLENLPPDSKFDVDIPLKDGTTLTGLDMGWYNTDPADPSAGEITEDDRSQIRLICDVPSFYNKTNILMTRGNHDRAVCLVELMRDSAFHSDKGGEIVWHIEIWYFKNQHGGWEKVQQQNKVIARERFKSRAEYESAGKKLKWEPLLGGIILSKNEKRTIDYPPAPASQPIPVKRTERELDP